MTRILDRISIPLKLYFIVLLSIAAFVFLAYFGSQNVKTTLTQERNIQTRSQVQNAYSLVNHYYKLSQSGALSEGEAKRQAMNAIEDLRYSGDEYFWINNTNAVLVMHPFAKSIIGVDLSNHENKKLHPLFSAFATIATQNEEGGYHSYFWPKPNEEPGKLFEKTSYVKLFKPWGWVIGTGVYVDDIEKAYWKSFQSKILIVLAISIVYILLATVVARSIAKPLEKLVKVIQELAKDNTSIEIGYTDRGDEIGHIAQATDNFKQRIIENNHLKEEQERAKQRNEEKRKEEMRQLADEFDESIGSVIKMLDQTCFEMKDVSSNLTAVAADSTNKSNVIVESSEQARNNVNTVAAAAEEMSLTVQEISSSMTQTLNTINSASDKANKAGETMTELAEAAEKISNVSMMIQDIAEQTNLLALNATIEAARAGDAGKGFAVVANEVKSLSTETAKATEEITQQIQTVQGITDDAVKIMKEVLDAIKDIKERSTTVSSAVEEQAAASKEIAQNTQQAATRTEEANSRASEILTTAQQTNTSADNVVQASSELENQSKILNEKVDTFLNKIRST